MFAPFPAFCLLYVRRPYTMCTSVKQTHAFLERTFQALRMFAAGVRSGDFMLGSCCAVENLPGREDTPWPARSGWSPWAALWGRSSLWRGTTAPTAAPQAGQSCTRDKLCYYTPNQTFNHLQQGCRRRSRWSNQPTTCYNHLNIAYVFKEVIFLVRRLLTHLCLKQKQAEVFCSCSELFSTSFHHYFLLLFVTRAFFH